MTDATGLPDGISQGPLMFMNTVFVDPERYERFDAAMREILPKARNLDACLALEAGQVTDQPGVVVLVERWRNGTEFFTEVLALPFYRDYLAETEPLYVKPRLVSILRPFNAAA